MERRCTVIKRTEQYRTTKTGAVRVYSGTYVMPVEVRVAFACRPGVTVIAEHQGQEAFAVSSGSVAQATAPFTVSYACADGAKALAIGMNTRAIAMASGARSYARKIGATAWATVAGAKAFKGDRSGVVVEDFIQSVFPNQKSKIALGYL